MTRTDTTRRRFPAALLLASLMTLAPAASIVNTAHAREADIARHVCQIDWRKGDWHVKQLIRCAASYHGVGKRNALYIAWRESRYQPSAYNSYGNAAGIYQHLLRYWPDRAEDFGFENWSAFNARANIFVTMRMVRRYGWSPWGG